MKPHTLGALCLWLATDGRDLMRFEQYLIGEGYNKEERQKIYDAFDTLKTGNPVHYGRIL